MVPKDTAEGGEDGDGGGDGEGGEGGGGDGDGGGGEGKGGDGEGGGGEGGCEGEGSTTSLVGGSVTATPSCLRTWPTVSSVVSSAFFKLSAASAVSTVTVRVMVTRTVPAARRRAVPDVGTIVISTLVSSRSNNSA